MIRGRSISPGVQLPPPLAKKETNAAAVICTHSPLLGVAGGKPEPSAGRTLEAAVQMNRYGVYFFILAMWNEC